MSGPLYSAQHYAMKPSRGTLFLRTFAAWQFIRFLAINLRMTVMILKSHDSKIEARAKG